MPRVTTTAINAVRGAMIGTAEVLPGISGGTVMMIVGIYERLITSAGHFLGAVRQWFTNREAAREEMSKVRWDTVIPVILGMIPAVLIGAKLIAPLAEEHPVQTLGLFFGMSIAAIAVPAGVVGKNWNARWFVIALIAAIIAFILVSLPPQNVPQNPIIIFLAASVAVCALALPGLSGSFLLLTIGLYYPTMDAINDRDLVYLAFFGLGVFFGLACFLRLLMHMLENHQILTLVVVSGIMAGAVRALWPWQHEEQRQLLAPTEHVPMTVALMVVGAIVVLGITWVGRRLGDH